MDPDGDGWVEIKRGNRVKTIKSPIATATSPNNPNVSNNYSAFSATIELDCPDPPPSAVAAKQSTSRVKATNRKTNSKKHVRHILRLLEQQESKFLDRSIARAEHERTIIAKADLNNKQRRSIDSNHHLKQPPLSLLQKGRNLSYNISSAIKRSINSINSSSKRVSFAPTHRVRTFPQQQAAVYVTYDSGADGNYMSESDRRKAGLPILRTSTKRVSTANGGTSRAKHVTQLPFSQLSPHANQADSFDDFPTSLMSVGKTCDDGTISIFTKNDVTVYNEQDVLITCKGEPILIGVRDEHGRYRIPLVQQKGQWQPRTPRKRVTAKLQQANSVYDLPSIEQAIKWMHAVCGYPVKSTWIKAIKAGNFVGWPLLTEKNVNKYYPESNETQQGHMNQARKNVRSTKRQPLETCNAAFRLRGKKEKDVFVKTYDVRETIFSDQTGKYPTTSQRGNKYIMVLVEIDSNAILVEPMKSRNDSEMIRAYDAIVQRLIQAGMQPRKHVLDNEISENMKQHIKTKYKFSLELVPPGCHRRNAAEVAIRNFKAHFLSVLAGTAESFPTNLWDRLLPQTEITLNLLRQSNATPTVSAYAHLSGPFDYNKMPLAPMGCEVQVHEKTDKRGTWAYHCVDGWYLFTSPEHYRVHNCQIKQTKKERLTDTISFKHKHITNPSISPADKLMNALAHLKATLADKINDHPTHQLKELQKIVTNINPIDKPTVSPPKQKEQALPRVRDNATVPRVHNQPSVPRVPPTTTPIATVPIRIHQRKRRSLSHLTHPINHPTLPPAASTRSKTAASRAAQKPPTPSRLRQPTASSRSKTTRRAHAVMRLPKGTADAKFLRAFQKLEQDVEQAMHVLDKESGKLLNYRQLLQHPKYKKEWSLSSANEFGRLAQGVGGRIKNPTNTIRFIRENEIPKERRKDVTYGSFVCTVRPEKAEPNRTRFTVGGNKINYPGEVATPTAEMLAAKILFNSVVSTPGAKFMTMDVSNFYLMTPLKRPEYIRVRLVDLPDEIIKEYKLRDKATKNGSIYLEVTKGMYGLPQAGLLANELLEKRLNKHGYYQSKLVPGLWKHESRPIQFTLVVDDFGVKYIGREHAEHLKSVLEQHYKVTTDWTGERYIGIHLKWDYAKRQVHLYMPGYVKKALLQFQHVLKKKQNQPFPHTPIKYGAKKQYATEESKAPALNATDKKFVQKVCGKFLFYGRAVDSTLLTPISAIASQSANPTTDTLNHTRQLLDYLATQEDAVLTYNKSDMILAVHSDASYLSEPKARSRAGGHFFLSTYASIPPNNGAILNIAHVIKHVMSSATEAELAALYIMAREAVYIRIILEELGHKQPPTPIQTDNSMADAVINGKVQPKRTKAMDMRFHWLRDRECQKQFKFYWRPGKTNYADYWTKHHSAAHHINMRKEFLTPLIVLEMLNMQQQKQTAAKAA